MTATLNPSSSPKTEPAPAGPAAAPKRGQLIFVVDDDPLMGTLLETILQGAGYRVQAFTDGMDAVALAATQPPDLLLVDLTMPLLSGAGTLARLRELQPRLPVLVISGVTPEEARAAAPAANGYLAKPFMFYDLLRAVAGLRAS